MEEVVEKGVPSTCKEQGKKVVTASVTYQEEVYTSEEHEIALPLAPHTIEEVAAKAATCTVAGNKAHWTCSVCGKLFSDNEGEAETTLDKVTVLANGHSYGTPTWNWAEDHSTATATFTCKEGDDTQTVDATIEKTATPGSCTSDGERTYTATVTFGGETYTDVKKETIPAGHQLEAVAAKAPTCTEDGNSSYYKCSECGRCTSDSKGEMEIDEASMVLKAKGHTFEEGKCTVCGAEDPDFVPETGLTGGEIAAIVISSVVAAGAVVALVIILRKVKFKTKK